MNSDSIIPAFRVDRSRKIRVLAPPTDLETFFEEIEYGKPTPTHSREDSRTTMDISNPSTKDSSNPSTQDEKRRAGRTSSSEPPQASMRGNMMKRGKEGGTTATVHPRGRKHTSETTAGNRAREHTTNGETAATTTDPDHTKLAQHTI